MISGSNLDGLPPPEQFWGLLAAAGVSPMLQSMILMDFGSRLGSLWGHFSVIFLKKGSPFCKQFCRSFLERLRGSFWSPKSDRKVGFSGVLDMLQT